MLVTACVVAIDWAVDARSRVYPHHHLTCTYLQSPSPHTTPRLLLDPGRAAGRDGGRDPAGVQEAGAQVPCTYAGRCRAILGGVCCVADATPDRAHRYCTTFNSRTGTPTRRRRRRRRPRRCSRCVRAFGFVVVRTAPKTTGGTTPLPLPFLSNTHQPHPNPPTQSTDRTWRRRTRYCRTRRRSGATTPGWTWRTSRTRTRATTATGASAGACTGSTPTFCSKCSCAGREEEGRLEGEGGSVAAALVAGAGLAVVGGTRSGEEGAAGCASISRARGMAAAVSCVCCL